MTDPEEPGDLPLRVSTLELFFDLVFVFAITQLTGILAHDVTVEDGFRVLLVFGALWWMYGGYVWLANARTPSRTTERLLMLAGMAGFLIMGLVITAGIVKGGAAYGLWAAALAVQVLSPFVLPVHGRFAIQPSHFTERHGALLILIVAAALVAERRAALLAERRAAVDTVDA